MEDLPSMGDQFIGKIYQLIDENLDNEHFSVEDLAKHAGLSRSMLHRKLIKLTGKSATDLITEKRLLRAREMLEKNVATVSEIAYKVGFGSPSYFNKVFKNYFRISPGDVRKGGAIIPHKPAWDHQQESPSGAWEKIKHAGLILLLGIIALILAGAGYYYLLKKDKPMEKSIAILPFDNLSLDNENQFFADGIVEDLLNRLSKIEGLKVISRTSSEMFRDKGTRTVPEIAELLGVSYILEGTVQRESNNVRINIQLIDAGKDDHILSKQYDRNLSEVFKIQSEIAGQIASELSLVLTDQQISSLRQISTKNLKAFEYYQMGRFHSSKRWIDGYQKGIEYYEKAIAEDPQYGLAYAGLADNYHLMALQGWVDMTEGKNKAIALAMRALDLDPKLAEPHAVLGDLYTYVDWNWDMAERELKQAIQIGPNYSTAHQYYSELLYITGRYDQAREQIDMALELDPFSFIIHYINSLFYYGQKQFMESLAENKVCQELVRDHNWAVRNEFDIFFNLGMEKEAIESFRRYGKLSNQYDPAITDSVFQNEGLDGLLRVKIRTETDQTLIACWHITLGDYKTAMGILENLFHTRNLDQMDFMRFEFRKLNDDPDFMIHIEELGLLK